MYVYNNQLFLLSLTMCRHFFINYAVCTSVFQQCADTRFCILPYSYNVHYQHRLAVLCWCV